MRASMRASPMSDGRPARGRRRRARGSVLCAIGLAMLAVLLAVMILGPLIAPYDPAKSSPHSLEGASALHWLGTDSIGRDELSRLIVGGRGTMGEVGACLQGAVRQRPQDEIAGAVGGKAAEVEGGVGRVKAAMEQARVAIYALNHRRGFRAGLLDLQSPLRFALGALDRNHPVARNFRDVDQANLGGTGVAGKSACEDAVGYRRLEQVGVVVKAKLELAAGEGTLVDRRRF